MAIYLATKQDVCRFYKEDFWGELRIRKNVYARINKFLFGRKKRKFDNSTRFDVIKLDNKRFKRRKRLTKEQIRFIQKEKIKHYFLNLSEYGLRSILLRTKAIKSSKGQNYKDRNLRDAFTIRLDHLIFSFGWATSLGHARALIKKGAIQVNHFIPTRIDFIPMPGDEIQVRRIYKPIIRRKLISLRQKRLKTAFKLSRRRLGYYLANVRYRNWKMLRPKFYYKKFKLFRNPNVRKANFRSTNRFFKFYKRRLTRHSRFTNWFHPKNFNRFKKRLRYPFRHLGKFYDKFYKSKALQLRDYEYNHDKQQPDLDFDWLYKLRPINPDDIDHILEGDNPHKRQRTLDFQKSEINKNFKSFIPKNKDFSKSSGGNNIPQTNRERLHSRHVYNRHQHGYTDQKSPHFKGRPPRKKFDKFESDQTAFESDLFYINRSLYFSIINDPIKRANIRELEIKKINLLKNRLNGDTDNKDAYITLYCENGDVKIFKASELQNLLNKFKKPIYWAEVYQLLLSNSLTTVSTLRFRPIRKVITNENVKTAQIDISGRADKNKLVVEKNFLLEDLAKLEPEGTLGSFIRYVQYQQLGLNRIINLLNFKKSNFRRDFNFFYSNLGPTNVTSLYKFTLEILHWPLIQTKPIRFGPLRQLFFKTWWGNSTLDSYKLLKGVIKHYYSYFSFFYAKQNFLTVGQYDVLSTILRLLRHLTRPTTTDENRMLYLQFPNLTRPEKKNSHYLSISKVRVLSKDRVRPAIVSDYTIPLLIARSKAIRGVLNPQFKILAQNIITLNKTLIQTFIKNSCGIIPSNWLKLPKLKKNKRKITAKFLTRLIVRLAKKLGIPVFNRPIYNLKLGIRGRAKRLLDKQANFIENTTFPRYGRFYYPIKAKRFERRLRRLKRKALRVRYKTLIARRFPNFIINYKLLLAIYLGPKRIFTTRRFKKRTRKAKQKLKRTLRFRLRQNKLFRVNRRKRCQFFFYFPFKFNLKTILTYYGNGKRMERLNRENDVYITYPHLPYNTRF
jgi:ribosomal protein S4